MKLTDLRSRLALVSLVAMVTQTSMAQGLVNRTYSRPSEQTASQRLGILGGRYTGQNNVAGLRSRTLNPNRLDPGGSGFGYRFGTGPASQMSLSPLLSPAEQFSVNVPTGGAVLGSFSPSNHRLQSVSGLSLSTQLHTPLAGWSVFQGNQLQIRTPEYSEARFTAQDPFRTQFGLQPPREEASENGAAPRPVTSVATAIETETDRQLQMNLERGQDAFKRGTNEANPARLQDLTRCVAALQSVVRLDPQAEIATLLLVQAAMEREQITYAAYGILRAVRRNPKLFQAPVDLHSYYGDPQLLDKRLRQYLRSIDFNPDSTEAAILSSYCAWMLGDLQRAMQAITRADEISRGEPVHHRVRMMKLALESVGR